MHVRKRKFCSFTVSLQKPKNTKRKFALPLRFTCFHFSSFYCNLCRNGLFNFLIWKLCGRFHSGNQSFYLSSMDCSVFSVHLLWMKLTITLFYSTREENANPDKMIIKTKNRQNAFCCSFASFGKHFVRFYKLKFTITQICLVYFAFVFVLFERIPPPHQRINSTSIITMHHMHGTDNID